MNASKIVQDGIKNAVKTYFTNDIAYFKPSGVKKFEVLDIMERPFEGSANHRYHVLVKHKEIDGYENCSAFQVIFFHDRMCFGQAMFDGHARLEKDGKFSYNDIAYGSFTREMARDWLNNVEQKMKGVA